MDGTIAELPRPVGYVLGGGGSLGAVQVGMLQALGERDVPPDIVAGTSVGSLNGAVLAMDPRSAANRLSHMWARMSRERVFPGGLTYSGHPLACASIVATVDAMRDEDIIGNAARIGQQVLGPGLRELAGRHPVIGEVRGTGVFWALDLVSDRQTRAMLAPYGASSDAMNALVADCKARGLTPFTNYNRLHVVPPCTVSEGEAKEGLAILDAALSVADGYYTG